MKIIITINKYQFFTFLYVIQYFSFILQTHLCIKNFKEILLKLYRNIKNF